MQCICKVFHIERKKMVIHFTFPLVYLTIFNFSIYVILLSASPTLVLNLVHPNQIYSLEPPHVSRIEEASVARLDYLQAKETGDIIAHISPSIPTGFLVNISIGSPPVMQLLHMDTGSSFLWPQCRPCTNCYRQSLPMFDPSKSYTYRKVGKESCEASIPHLSFDAKTGSCMYSMKYVDDTGSKGT